MKSSFFLIIFICIFSSTFSQKSHEKYSEEEIQILWNNIVELEKNDSLYKELIVRHTALEREINLIRADQQHKIGSITNYFTIRITRLENSSKVNVGITENITSSKTSINNANIKAIEVSNKITEDDIMVEIQMLEFLRNIHFDCNCFRIKQSLAFKLDIVSDNLKKVYYYEVSNCGIYGHSERRRL